MYPSLNLSVCGEKMAIDAMLHKDIQHAGLAWLNVRFGTFDVNFLAMTPAVIIDLGEAIAAAGRKLDDEQKEAAIRAQLAGPIPDPFLPHKHTEADHIVAPDEPCDGTCTPEWTTEEILRREA